LKKNSQEKQDLGKTILRDLTGEGSPDKKKKRSFWKSIQIPALAILTGLICGAILIAATSMTVYAAFKQSIWLGFGEAFSEIGTAYWALFRGAIGDPADFAAAISSGSASSIATAFKPILSSLVQTTPYIFAGLACALGFRAGLFNIGVEGQLFMGAAAATYVGYAVTGLPAYIHMPLAFLAGTLVGALWGMIPGLLKVTTGGNEVINCIMMNYITYRLISWLLAGPMSRNAAAKTPISPLILPTSYIPQIFNGVNFHLGFFIALAVAFIVWWVLFKTTWGFNLRTVGNNPRAAKYAGMSIAKTTILGMLASGALAGMAGANEVLAVNHSLTTGLSSGYGFNSIALALLANNHPVGVIFSALLFGVLRNGATKMMLNSSIPIDIVTIIQALVIIFVAAPAIIRSIYRLRKPKEEETAAGINLSSWGGGK
jgi:general nucleoside transport system permease protein